MSRIFLTLSVLSSLALLLVFWLGWRIGDAAARDVAAQSQVTLHFLSAVAALCFSILVHAVVLTYFMGTGRWLEETCTAYKLGDAWQSQSREIKWRLYPTMLLAILLLIVTGAFGAACDPASAFRFSGFGPLDAAQVHLVSAIATLAVNAAAAVLEFKALVRNGALVNDVVAQVRRMRAERGLGD